MSAAVDIQHAKRMRRIILPSVACLTVPYFSTLSHKRHDFRKNLLNTKYVFDFLYEFCLKKILIPRGIRRDIIRNVHRSSCQVPVILVGFKKKIELSLQVLEKSPNIKFHKNPSSRSRVVPCGRAGRLIDMTKLIVAFRNFANAPKNLAKFNTF